MAALLQPLHLLCIVASVLSVPAPAPGRVPKVYNALITSNQNLEPSKAYPVYQPVLHEFAFPYQPAIYYGDFPFGNGLQRIPTTPNKEAEPPRAPQAPEPASIERTDEKPAPSEVPPAEPSQAQDDGKPTSAPPSPPSTESPIPLNQFGLPPRVLPLGRIDPAYQGFNQIGPYFSYPSVRFYDPFDPYSFNPYVNLPPLYRPFTNVLEPGSIGFSVQPGAKESRPSVAAPQPIPQDSQSPPPEPSDVNVLNYSSKDPNIPNVPPPPLPQGGLRTDSSE